MRESSGAKIFLLCITPRNSQRNIYYIQYTRDQLVDGNLTPTALAVVRVHNVFPSRLLELCRALAEDMRTIPTVAAVRGETKIKHGWVWFSWNSSLYVTHDDFWCLQSGLNLARPLLESVSHSSSPFRVYLGTAQPVCEWNWAVKPLNGLHQWRLVTLS